MARKARSRWWMTVVGVAAGGLACGGVSVPPAMAAATAATDQPVVYVGDVEGGGAGDVRSFQGTIPGPKGGASVGSLRGPSVVEDGDTTWMWFCSSAGSSRSTIGMKYSLDQGRSWALSTNYSLSPTDNGSDTEGVCDPSVVRVGSYYYLTYVADDGDTSQLFVARAGADRTGKAPGDWRWEKWTGSGWAWEASPQPLSTTADQDALQPSVVVVDGTLLVFYLQPILGTSELFVHMMKAPLGEDWPQRLSKPVTVLKDGGRIATLDVKWEEVAKKFVAVGIAGRGRSLVGFVGDGATAQFRPTRVDVVDGYASKVEDMAVHGDGLGHLRPAITYEVPPGVQSVVTLRHSVLAFSQLPTGAFKDSFANADRWLTRSEGSPTSGWKIDSGSLAFDPPTRAAGEAVAKAWLGDGLYRVDIRGEENGVGNSVVEVSGIQIGRQQIAGHDGDSGYTVLFRNNQLTVTKGGPSPFTKPVKFNPINGWPFIQGGKDPGKFTLNVLKAGPHLSVWPSWPGIPNENKQFGGTVLDLGDESYGAGHPALIVDHQGSFLAGSGTWFDNFSFTPTG